MKRIAALAILVALAGCGDYRLPRARPAPSGQTAGNGGGEAALGNVPKGTTNTPYSTK